MMVVVDTSAFIALLMEEPERAAISGRMDGASAILLSAATLVESRMVLRSRGGERLVNLLNSLVAEDRFEIVPVDEAQANAAHHAFVLYGKGSGHPAQLNFGDLFSYALARTRRLPLLYKGADFASTDIQSALETES
jgi:ribonuclease VapC